MSITGSDGGRRARTLAVLCAFAIMATLSSCVPPQQPIRHASPALSLRAEAEAALKILFDSYMREDAREFMTRVHPDFAGTADNGVALTASTIRLSIEDDFRNYDEITFDWNLNSVQEFEDGNVVEADVTWSERYKNASGSQAGVETRRNSQTTTFIFRRDGESPRLSTWRGAAAFGLAAPGGVGQ